ncbi:hypothetical protein DK749_24940 [Salmonella enterica subsp. salamae]|nr:hypothetical protein [Salmonella enterica subsp. salamae]
MHQIFLVSPCHYMQRGIREVMATAPVSVQVLTVSCPEDILSVSRTDGNRMVLVLVPVQDAVTASRASLFLWRMTCLQSEGRMPDISVLLLSDRTGGRYPRLSERLSPESLRYALTTAVTQPGNTRIFRPGQCHLSVLQRKILLASLAGLEVDEMARTLNVSRRGVLAGRSALIQKLGLRNRLELMGLMAADFI